MILNNSWRHFTLAFLLVIMSGFYGCSVKYSFSGVVIHPDINTCSVQFFPNRAPLVQAQLSQIFTEALKDKVQGQTRLTLVNGSGDVDFSGEIRNYETRPVAITGAETAALTRLSVTVRVKYVNYVDPDLSYDASFTRFEDFESTRDLSQVEDGLIALIVEQLVEDAFNRAFVNW
jgi:predicted Zn-dependent protease